MNISKYKQGARLRPEHFQDQLQILSPRLPIFRGALQLLFYEIFPQKKGLVCTEPGTSF